MQSIATISKDYSTLSDIYTANINDPQFISLLVMGCSTMLCLQKLGEILHPVIVKPHRQKKLPPPLFGTYFQSFFHVILVSIASYLILLLSPDKLENMDETHPDFYSVRLYRISTVISISYFIMITPYEMFGIEQSAFFRIVMSIHHIIAIMAQSCGFLTNPLIARVVAFGFQCEFSTIFLNLRTFGLATDNKYMYFIGGCGSLIFYPLTRIIGLMYTITKTYQQRDKIIIHAGYNAYLLAMLGQIFVLCMSSGYTCLLFKSPRKMIYLQTPKKRTA